MESLFMQEHEKWLNIAKYDLKVAKGLQSLEFFTAVVYHCQQAAEKALKGYLVFKGREVTKTHDLIKLLDLCILLDGEFIKKGDAASFLNPLSTKFRYPSDFIIPDCEDADITIKHASSIIRFVIKKIAEPDTGQKNIF